MRRHPHLPVFRPTLALVAAVGIVLVFATARAENGAPAAAAPGIDLARYAEILSRHTVTTQDVVGTRVDYRALRGDTDWRRVADSVRAARPSTFDRDGRLAFWINAYNILTIDLVLEHYPVESIRDIGSFLFPVWNREVARIEGEEVSLGGIEHDILREMGDPRIHGAIVCASTSCPPLARTPFRAESIDADLDATMRRWLSIPEKGYAIDREAGRLRVSAIFDWFEDDFEATGGVIATIARYADPEDARWLRGPGRRAPLRYLDYDWRLNDRVR